MKRNFLVFICFVVHVGIREELASRASRITQRSEQEICPPENAKKPKKTKSSYLIMPPRPCAPPYVMGPIRAFGASSAISGTSSLAYSIRPKVGIAVRRAQQGRCSMQLLFLSAEICHKTFQSHTPPQPLISKQRQKRCPDFCATWRNFERTSDHGRVAVVVVTVRALMAAPLLTAPTALTTSILLECMHDPCSQCIAIQRVVWLEPETYGPTCSAAYCLPHSLPLAHLQREKSIRVRVLGRRRSYFQLQPRRSPDV